MTAARSMGKRPRGRGAKADRPTGSAPRRLGRGALMVIAALLAGSAVIRLGFGLSDALALEGPEARAPAAAAEPPVVPALIEALRAREARIEAAEAAIADRTAALALIERTIDQKLAALTEAEENLSATIARASTAAEDDLGRLTAVYENMKPAEAAALFAAMAPEFAAGFLGRMRPEAAAGIMAGLEPQTAYAISVLLAGRNALVPRQ